MAARVERLTWRDEPLQAIALPGVELKLTLGLGSGLTSRGGRIFAVTDRGPNLFVSQAIDDYGLSHLEHLRGLRDAKFMPIPDAGPEIVELFVDGALVRIGPRTILRTAAGKRLSGRALPGEDMEGVFDLDGRPLEADVLGADTEAIAVMPDGGFFLAEEYGPSLLKADANGIVTERWVAEGRMKELAHRDILVSGVLPKRAGRRRRNRGIEALCASSDGRFLYVGFQSALKGEDEHAVPIWKLDAGSGERLAEYLYPFDKPSTFLRDAKRRKVGWDDLKICEFAWAGDDRLIVLERIAHSTKLYLIDLRNLPEKQLLFSSDDHPEVGPDMEGMTFLSPRELLLVSDNDFGVEGAETAFWRITLDRTLPR